MALENSLLSSCVQGTHSPSPLVCGHVAVDLDSLVGVSVDVDGVHATQGLPVQEMLGAVLRRGEQAVPWRGQNRGEWGV